MKATDEERRHAMLVAKRIREAPTPTAGAEIILQLVDVIGRASAHQQEARPLVLSPDLLRELEPTKPTPREPWKPGPREEKLAGDSTR